MKKRVYFKNGKIHAIHNTNQDTDECYPDCDCYIFDPSDHRIQDIDESTGETIMRKVEPGDDVPKISKPVTSSEFDKEKILNTLKSLTVDDLMDTVFKMKDI